MKLVSMKMSAEERKEQSSMVGGSKPPEYPYGLQITLDDDALKKLGLELPKVGDKIMFVADALVTSVNSYESTDKDQETSVSLQITEMLCDSAENPAADPMQRRAEKIYKS